MDSEDLLELLKGSSLSSTQLTFLDIKVAVVLVAET